MNGPFKAVSGAVWFSVIVAVREKPPLNGETEMLAVLIAVAVLASFGIEAFLHAIDEDGFEF